MVRGYKGLGERLECAQLSDEQLLERVRQAKARLREAREWHDQVIADAMIRGIHQTVIVERSGLSRRAMFYAADREWERRRAEETPAVDEVGQ